MLWEKSLTFSNQKFWKEIARSKKFEKRNEYDAWDFLFLTLKSWSTEKRDLLEKLKQMKVRQVLTWIDGTGK